MLITLSITNASNVMQYFFRFTDDIFVALVSLIFVIEAGRSIGGDLFDGKLTQSEAWIGAEDNLTVIGSKSSAWSEMASAEVRGSSTSGPECEDSRTPRRS